MHDDVCAELERPLQDGVANVLSTTTSAPTAWAASATAAMSIMFSSGFDGDSSQTIRVFGEVLGRLGCDVLRREVGEAIALRLVICRRMR